MMPSVMYSFLEQIHVPAVDKMQEPRTVGIREVAIVMQGDSKFVELRLGVHKLYISPLHCSNDVCTIRVFVWVRSSDTGTRSFNRLELVLTPKDLTWRG